MNKNFIYNSSNNESINGISEWQSPSNIALVKYFNFLIELNAIVLIY